MALPSLRGDLQAEIIYTLWIDIYMTLVLRLNQYWQIN